MVPPLSNSPSCTRCIMCQYYKAARRKCNTSALSLTSRDDVNLEGGSFTCAMNNKKLVIVLALMTAGFYSLRFGSIYITTLLKSAQRQWLNITLSQAVTISNHGSTMNIFGQNNEKDRKDETTKIKIIQRNYFAKFKHSLA